MFSLFATVTLTCAEAERVALNALNHPSLPSESAIEIVIELDAATGGKCNLPGLINNEPV